MLLRIIHQLLFRFKMRNCIWHLVMGTTGCSTLERVESGTALVIREMTWFVTKVLRVAPPSHMACGPHMIHMLATAIQLPLPTSYVLKLLKRACIAISFHILECILGASLETRLYGMFCGRVFMDSDVPYMLRLTPCKGAQMTRGTWKTRGGKRPFSLCLSVCAVNVSGPPSSRLQACLCLCASVSLSPFPSRPFSLAPLPLSLPRPPSPSTQPPLGMPPSS
jgi:hypothetical protein